MSTTLEPFPPPPEGYAPPETAEEAAEATWQAVDLTDILDGTHRPPQPAFLTRTDGVRLLYPGMTHSIHGESESGKSLVVQHLAAGMVNDGHPVLYLDFESDPAQVVGRLRTFGATTEALAARFAYVHPETGPGTTAAERDAWRGLLAQNWALVVIDGTTDALGDVATWQRVLPNQLAKRTGAAVVAIDHVTKDREGRGRFALGAQAKLSGLSGAAYSCEVTRQLGDGLCGEVVLRVVKDRPGQVRPHASGWRKTDRSAEAARLTFDATGPVEVVTVDPPSRSCGAYAARPPQKENRTR